MVNTITKVPKQIPSIHYSGCFAGKSNNINNKHNILVTHHLLKPKNHYDILVLKIWNSGPDFFCLQTFLHSLHHSNSSLKILAC